MGHELYGSVRVTNNNYEYDRAWVLVEREAETGHAGSYTWWEYWAGPRTAALWAAGGAVARAAPGPLAPESLSPPPRLPARLHHAPNGQIMDRNPSPPSTPNGDEGEEEVVGGDCIGSTVYSKHWLFGVLSGLIQVWKLAPLAGSPYFPRGVRPTSGSPSGPGATASPGTPPLPHTRTRGGVSRVASGSSPDPELPQPPRGAPPRGRSLAAGMPERLRLKHFYFCKFSKNIRSCKSIARGFAPCPHGRFRSLSPNFSVLWAFVVVEKMVILES